MPIHKTKKMKKLFRHLPLRTNSILIQFTPMGRENFRPEQQKSLDIPVSTDIETQAMAEIQHREYVSLDEFNALLERAKIDRKNSKRGTYMPGEEGSLYVYAKRDFIARDLAIATEKRRLCQELTRRGALFPETQWGIYERPSGQFQIFAVTRTLELAPRAEDPLRNSKIIRERLGPEYEHVLDPMEANRNPMGHVPGSSDLYPVDIEVIGLAFDEKEAIQREIEFQNRANPSNMVNV